MAAIGTVQIAGNIKAGPAEVELNTLAYRNIVRPQDYTFAGSYSVSPQSQGIPTNCNIASGTNGSTAIAVSANNAWWNVCFRNPSSNLAAIRKVSVNFLALSGGVANTPMLMRLDRAFNMTIMPSQTVTGTGGTIGSGAPQVIEGPNLYQPTRLRSGTMNESSMEIVGTKSTAGLAGSPVSGATWLVDPSYIQGAVSSFNLSPSPLQYTTASTANTVTSFGMSAFSNSALSICPFIFGLPTSNALGQPVTMFDARVGEHPLVLTQYQSLLIGFQSLTTVSAFYAASGAMETDVWFNIIWDEYSPNLTF